MKRRPNQLFPRINRKKQLPLSPHPATHTHIHTYIHTYIHTKRSKDISNSTKQEKEKEKEEAVAMIRTVSTTSELDEISASYDGPVVDPATVPKVIN